MLDIVMLEEDDFETRVYIFLYSVLKKYSKICYLALSNTYDFLKDDFKKQKIPLQHFHFIDVLTTGNREIKSHKHCTYLPGPEMKKILTSIHKAINNHGCNLVLIDNVSHMLHYFKDFEIQQLTNLLKQNYTEIKKIYFVHKQDTLIQDQLETTLKDLNLFADKVIDLRYSNLELS